MAEKRKTLPDELDDEVEQLELKFDILVLLVVDNVSLHPVGQHKVHVLKREQ